MSTASRQFVWDLPTRLFHWALVGLLAFSWWSAENYRMDWHRLSGQAVLFLLIFRLIWGIIGTDTARFSQFLRGPGVIRSYLGRKDANAPVARPGHNPLGGWSVVAMLLALGAQIGSGLFAVDVDGIESGPLSYLVDFDQGRLASAIHDTSFNVLLALIALHILAIAFHLIVRRQNLVGAMLTGSRSSQSHEAAPVRRAGIVQLLCALALSGAISWWVFAAPPL